MSRQKINYLIIATSGLIGYLWGHNLKILPLISIIFIPVLWSWVSTRFLAAFVPAIYALLATRGLIFGSAVFFDCHLIFGFLLWLLAALPHYLAGFFSWFKNPQKRYFLGIPLLLLFLTLPPVMFVGWANPLLASGLWFPNLGLWSLLCCLIFMIFIASYLKKTKLFLAVFLLVSIQAYLGYKKHNFNNLEDFVAHQSNFQNLESKNPLKILERQGLLQDLIIDKKINVYPEMVAGNWDNFLANYWIAHIPNNTYILLGAYLEENKNYKNIIALIDNKKTKIIYQQRLPMIAGMFNPFANTNFPITFKNQDLFYLNNKKLGFAICFEQVILLTMLQTSIKNPDIIIATSNLWWSPKSLQLAQRQSLRLWQKFLNVPFVEAINGEKI